MKNNLTKKELIVKLKKKTGYPQILIKKLFKIFIDNTIKNIKYNKVYIKNFGTFKVLLKKKRIGRNPKTKKEYLIDSRKSVSFYASKSLLKKINDLNE